MVNIDNPIGPGPAPGERLEDPAYDSQMLEEFSRASVGEAPTIAEPYDSTVTLPGGVLTPSGKVLRHVTVRELTGADEEAIAKIRSTLSGKQAGYVQAIDKTLLRMIESIDGQEVTPEIVSGMLVGDREAVLLGIRRASFGDTLELSTTCGACEAPLLADIDLTSDIEMRTLDERLPVYEVDLQHTTARIRLADGAAQWAAASIQGDVNMPTLNTAVLSSCLVSVGGVVLAETREGPQQFVLNLTARDRRTLVNFLADKQPGPRLTEVKVDCSECGNEVLLPLDALDLLFL